MAAYFRLQELISVSGNSAQDKRDAIDVGGYRHPVIQVRVPSVSQNAYTLQLQHAAVLEDEAFTDISGATVDLVNDTNKVLVLEDTLRYLRWRVSGASGAASFVADAIAR